MSTLSVVRIWSLSLATLLMATLLAGCAPVDLAGAPLSNPNFTVADLYIQKNNYWLMSTSLYAKNGSSLQAFRRIDNEQTDALYKVTLTYDRILRPTAVLIKSVGEAACASGASASQQDNFLAYTCLHPTEQQPIVLRDFGFDLFAAPELNPAPGSMPSIAQVPSLNVPLWLTENTLSASFEELDLDTKQKQTKPTSMVGTNLSVQFSPSFARSSLNFCIRSPGVVMDSGPIPTLVNIFSSDVLQSVQHPYSDIGAVTFDGVRACANNEYMWSTTDETLPVQQMQSQLTEFRNLEKEPISLDVPDFDLQSPMAEDLLVQIFGKDAVAGFTDEELAGSLNAVKSGRWILQTYPEFTGLHAAHQFAQLGHKLLSRTGAIFTMQDLVNGLTDSCRLLRLSGSPKYDEKMQEFCGDPLKDLQFVGLPTDVDQDMQKKGCYDGFASLFDDKGNVYRENWWSQECTASFNFVVRLPANDDIYQSRMHVLMASMLSDEDVPSVWQSYMHKLSIDPWTLHELLRMWDEQRKTSIEAADWEDVPKMLQDLHKRILAGYTGP